MPIIKRSIEPIYVSRVVVSPGVRNELEFVSNSTLASVIQQLSSLSRHAEDLFTELHRETSCVFYRNCKISERVEQLTQKIQQLNPVKDSVSLQDMNQRKPFRSSVTKEQQILTLSTRPQAISEKYAECEPPPPLHKLDAYREDGKDSLKFYTDPSYFVELWCQEMSKDDNQVKKHKHRNRRTRPAKEPRTIRAPRTHVEEYKERRHGPEFVGMQARRDQVEVRSNTSLDSRASHRPDSLEIQMASRSTLQRDIVGYAFSQADYGLVAFSNGISNRTSLAESSLGPPTPTSTSNYGNRTDYLPNSNARDEITNYNDNYNHVTSRGTPNREKQQLANDASMRQYASSQYGDRYTSDVRGQANRDISSPRPTMPPPAPPEEYRRGSASVARSGSIMNRDTLPPPPPAPVPQVARSDSSASKSGRSYNSPPKLAYDQSEPVPVSPKGKANTSFDLPPPPSPPPMSFELIPSPPVPPPPIDEPQQPLEGYQFSPPPPPLPPPITDMTPRQAVRKDIKHLPDWDNNNEVPLPDNASLASDTSSATVSSKTEEQGKLEKPAVRDTRSDLLSAIRTGIQLRKVEERRLKTEQKQKTSVRLDVQAIMEAAFERRRKALEENDSDKDYDDDAEDNWSDDGQ